MALYQEEHRIFQQTIRRFSEKHLLPNIRSWEESRFFPSEILPRLGAEGFLGILAGEEWGGSGRDYRYAAAWCEEFGRVPSVGFTTGINMHALVVCPAVERYGTAAAKERWLRQAIEGKAIGAYAFTEPGAGSDLTQVRTTAKKDGDSYLLNGSKIFITNGKRANFVLVLARTELPRGPGKAGGKSGEKGSEKSTGGSHEGFTTFLVDTTEKGFAVARTLGKLGWHASDTAELAFSDVRVPKEYVLGAPGQGWSQAMTSLEWERLMLALSALGGASQCLEDTITYVNDRKVFGQTVGSFDRNRECLALLWSRLQAGRALCHACVLLLEKGERCRRQVSLAKRNVCELAIEVANECLQLHGGYGYTDEFLPERWLRDLRLNTIGGGASEVMTRVAARELMSGR